MEGVPDRSKQPLSRLDPAIPLPATFAIVTFGCKVNQYDSQVFREALGTFVAEAGPGEPADLVIVNTCSVTGEAERQCRRALRQARSRHPHARIVAAGCVARRTDADLVAEGLADALVRGSGPDALLEAAGIAGASPGTPARITRMEGRTRAFVKVQDGCDRRCSFCIVPLLRGRSSSRPAAEVRDEVAGLAESGVPEVVLCGVELSAWHDRATGQRLPGLVRDLAGIPGLGRLRLSSLYPGRQSPELVELITGHPRICRHLHLPVQSGSDAVLGAMRRGYTAADVLGLARALRARDPGIGLTADILVGFPGETPEDAAATEKLVADCGFHRLHLFPFSPRPGTPAAALAPVPAGEVEERMGRLRAIGERLHLAALDGQVGGEVDAVVERAAPGGGDEAWRGTTGSYLPVRFRDPAARPGTIAHLRVTGHAGGELAGEPA